LASRSAPSSTSTSRRRSRRASPTRGSTGSCSRPTSGSSTTATKTAGFRHTGFDPRGALRGLGWQNVFALGTGAQYQASDALSLRLGYTFSLNPVGPADASFNIGSPTIIQHTIALGASYNVTKAFKLSLAYAHDFQSSVSGPDHPAVRRPRPRLLGPLHRHGRRRAPGRHGCVLIGGDRRTPQRFVEMPTWVAGARDRIS